jgi:murein DD-endopeptidase MepM/ murein hydrolase activator NlpD
LKQGELVKAGEVIGYLGMTGYSNTENVNNMTVPHLHFGMQIIFDESQKDGNNQIWIDVYNIVNLLSNNKIPVKKDAVTKDYYSAMNFH